MIAFAESRNVKKIVDAFERSHVPEIEFNFENLISEIKISDADMPSNVSRRMPRVEARRAVACVISSRRLWDSGHVSNAPSHARGAVANEKPREERGST
jgi:hypothetical protein